MKGKNNKKDTSWGTVALWYDELLEGEKDSYQTRVITPNVVRLLAPLKGKRILDVACGQGFFSRVLAEEGAIIDAADISEELIGEAKKKESKNITYSVAPADTLFFAKENTYDAAICVLALQNIENLNGVCTEVARVLKPGGTFLFVLNHPAFRIPKVSGWEWDEKKKIQYRRIEQYMSDSRAEIEMHPGKKGSPKTISFHRPLQVYMKALAKNGFAVVGLEEWISHKKSAPGPRASAEDAARKEFPLFMAIKAIQQK